jgi:hypothetical protein
MAFTDAVWGDIAPATTGTLGGPIDSGTWGGGGGLGINWAAAAQTLGAGGDKDDITKNPGTIPTLAPPQIQTPQSSVGHGRAMDIRELLNQLAEKQMLYQQAAHGPVVAGGLPQPKPRPLGLLGV